MFIFFGPLSKIRLAVSLVSGVRQTMANMLEYKTTCGHDQQQNGDRNYFDSGDRDGRLLRDRKGTTVEHNNTTSDIVEIIRLQFERTRGMMP